MICTGYVYRHIRLDKNEVFYIGIGGFNKKEPLYSYKRAYSNRRNNYWKNITNKTDYIVEIISEGLTREQACKKEIEFIKLYGRIDLGTGTLVNLTDGGEGSNGPKTEEHKKKIGLSNKGKKHTKDFCENISKRQTGYKHTDETKNKISKASKGNKYNLGRKHSQESIMNYKIGASKHSYDSRKSAAEKVSKPVYCVELDKIFKSITQAGIELNISASHISAVCNGKRKTAAGYKWKFV